MLMTGRCGNDESCQEEKRIFLPQSRQKCSHTPQPLLCPSHNTFIGAICS